MKGKKYIACHLSKNLKISLCYPDCGMVQIKDPLLQIEKNSS